MADPSLSVQDFSDYLDRKENAAVAQTLPSPDGDDPDKATRAAQIAQTLGADPAIVYSNLDAFESQLKAHLTDQIVRNNPHLQDYIHNDPLSSKISADDWGNLDNVSRAVSKIGQNSVVRSSLDGISAVLKGTREGARGATQLESMLQQSAPTFRADHPLIANLLDAMDFPIETAPRAMGAVFGGAQAGIKEAFRQITGDEERGERFAQDVMVFPQVFMPELMGPHVPPELNEIAKAARRSARASKAYIQASEEPPKGIDPIVDNIKSAQSKLDVQNIMDAFKAAQDARTKDRANEAGIDKFRNFLREHNGMSIGINVDAVRRLYGDKPPSPDDGILGWVPNIEQQIYNASFDHGDIHVPLADFLDKTDPAVLRELKDDIRPRPGGFTLNETKDLPPPKVEPELPLAQAPKEEGRLPTLQEKMEAEGTPRSETMGLVSGIQQASGVGPAVKLVRTFSGEGDLAGTHEFDFVDPQGNKIGDGQVTITGDHVHVDYMRGDGPGIFKLGPGVITELAQQLREQFPELRTISGARISGAREGMEEAPVIKRPLYPLSQELNWDLHGLLAPFESDIKSTGDRVNFGQGITAYLADHFTEREEKIYAAVQEELNRIAPGLKDVTAVRQLRVRAGAASGVFSRRNGLPFVMWALESPDAVGTARHEVIHFLRRGYLDDKEWGLLRDAAIKEDWMGKYDIRRRYGDQPLAIQIEEAVAEHFAHINRAEYWTDHVLTGYEKVLAKIRNVYERVRTAVRRELGKDADYRDVIARIERGEVGVRRPTEGIAGEPLAQREKQLELPGVTRVEDRPLIDRAKAFGMTEKEYRQILEKHLAKDDADTKFADEQNRKQIERRQTAEWKANEKAIRDRVEPDIRNRADLAADRFLREGTLYDQKLTGKPKLDADALSVEQKAMLPKTYYGKGGLHPDDVASLFGMHSGDDLVRSLGSLLADRGNLNPQQHLRKILSQEVARQMKLEHGDLAKNILDEAEDHVVSSTQIDLMNDQLFGAATRAGAELPFTKENVDSFIKKNFDNMIAGDISKEEFMHNANRARQLEVRELLDDNPAQALKQQQAHRFAFGYLKEMKAFEKVQKRFKRLTDRYKAREVSNRESDFTNVIHDIMSRFGIPVNRMPGDLVNELREQGYKGLAAFVHEKGLLGDTNAGSFVLDDRLFDPNGFTNADGTPKKVGQLTVDEYRALTDALTQLDNTSRDWSKLTTAKGKVEKAEVVGQLTAQVEANYDVRAAKDKEGKFMKGLRRFFTTGMLNPETWADRFDRNDIWGAFNQYITRPLITSENRKAALGREYGKKYYDLKPVEDGDRKVTSPFNDPRTGEKFMNFTRKNVATMISNWGNPYNRDILSKGYGADEGFLHRWLGANSTVSDWQRAEKLGKEIFNELFEKAQDVYRSIHGVAPPKIELVPFEIQTKDGVFKSEGWYHPIIEDPERSDLVRGAKTGEEYLDQDKGFYPSIANGYIKRRTGQVKALSLTNEFIPNRLGQIIHDIAYRAEMIDVAKIVRDKDFRRTMSQRLGTDYVKMFDDWLKNLAGAPNVDTRSMQSMADFSNYLLSNTVGTLIGFNPSTVLKHGPTAWVNSMYRVGATNFLKAATQLAGSKAASYYFRAVDSLFGGDVNRQESIIDFIRRNSEEIQRRERNWQESFGGAQKVLEGEMTWRERVIKWGSKAVAASDMASAMPTWLAEYNRVFEETGNHGDAVFAGDKAVRYAHGSTARTNLPELVRGAGPYGQWQTSLYGFFGTMMQRRAEIAFKLNDAYNLGREGEIKAASKKFAEAIPLFVVSMIAPTIIEEAVNAIGTDDHRTYLSRLADFAWISIASSMLFARDLKHDINLAGTAYQDLRNVAHIGADELWGHQKSFDRQHAGKSVQDLITAAGILTGAAPAQIGRTTRYGINVLLDVERPQNLQDILLGAMKGTTKPRVVR